jgi:hypothetical protein
MDSEEIIKILQDLGFAYNDNGFIVCAYDIDHGSNGWQYGKSYLTSDKYEIYIHQCQYCNKLTVHKIFIGDEE